MRASESKIMESVFHPKNPRGIFIKVPKQRNTEVCKRSEKLGEGFIIIHSSMQLFLTVKDFSSSCAILPICCALPPQGKIISTSMISLVFFQSSYIMCNKSKHTYNTACCVTQYSSPFCWSSKLKR